MTDSNVFEDVEVEYKGHLWLVRADVSYEVRKGYADDPDLLEYEVSAVNVLEIKDYEDNELPYDKEGYKFFEDYMRTYGEDNYEVTDPE